MPKRVPISRSASQSTYVQFIIVRIIVEKKGKKSKKSFWSGICSIFSCSMFLLIKFKGKFHNREQREEKRYMYIFYLGDEEIAGRGELVTGLGILGPNNYFYLIFFLSKKKWKIGEHVNRNRKWNEFYFIFFQFYSSLWQWPHLKINQNWLDQCKFM